MIRGLPGSGKSYLAKQIMQNVKSEKGWAHLENDMYFTNENGKYVWYFAELKNVYAWCLEETEKALLLEHDGIVSNCFIKRKHLIQYINLAKKYRVFRILYICCGNFQSDHDVPKTTIEEMKKNW